jgi:hypothetical protein
MSKYNNHQWSHADILDQDLEKEEFDNSVASDNAPYTSIIDDEPAYRLFSRFREDENIIYSNDTDEDSSDEIADNTFDDRESYRNLDTDDVYYLI